MPDTTKTLDWLDTQCDHALDEARRGNTIPANRLGAHPALGHYFGNVHCLRAITPEQWARENPPLLAEADRLRVQDEAARAYPERIAALEEQLARMAEQIERLAVGR